MDHQRIATDIHQAIVDFADAGGAFAVATVLVATGSTPRKAGTKAIIDASGRIWGTIGGGVVEAQAQKLAVSAIACGRPVVFELALGGDSARGASPICGGSMRVLIDPTAAGHRDVYAQAAEAKRGMLVTRVEEGPPPRVVVEFIPTYIEDGREGGDRLMEPLAPPPLLVIAGGGHVGQALALQAGLVGFEVVVIDDRPEFVQAGLYPPCTQRRGGDIATELAGFPVVANTYIAIVTRGHSHDKQALAACIGKPAAYIGMIGSKRKVAMIFADLLESGLATEDQLGGVHAPIGLDIGAQTVPEIATSIVAQLIAVRRKREGRP